MANRSNIMGLHELKNSPKVNHFDQSYRNLFTAKCGELLPVYFNILSPGDSIKLNASSFTRTAPLETAAFTRVRENIQFFAVKYSSLWRWFREQYKNMPTDMFGNSTARSAASADSTQLLNTKLPYLNSLKLRNMLSKLYDSAGTAYGKSRDVTSVYASLMKVDNPTSDSTGDFALFNGTSSFEDPSVPSTGQSTCVNRGELRYHSSAKLLQMLGYGSYSDFFSEDSFNNEALYTPVPESDINPMNSIGVSVFPLLGYHKICQDHYIYRQWQRYRANLCNIDYVSPSDSMDLSDIFKAQVNKSVTDGVVGSDYSIDNLSLIDMEYGNLPLDMFNGVLPNSQFGDMVVAPLSNLSAEIDSWHTDANINSAASKEITVGYTGVDGHLYVNNTNASGSSAQLTPVTLKGSSSEGTAGVRIDSLRSSIQIQRYKEIQMSSDQSYADLIQKHFGIRPHEINPEDSQYIGGYDTSLDINPQVNQNLAGENSATYGSAPTASGRGSISYTAKDEPVMVFGIYTAIPLMEYQCFGIDQRHCLADATDFPIPEFDSIGMETAPLFSLFGSIGISDVQTSSMDISKTYGYRPRYSLYKTEYDKVQGAFCSSLSQWTNAYSRSYLYPLWFNVADNAAFVGFPYSIPQYLFANSPVLLHGIFVDQNTLSTNDDNFYVGMFFKVDVTRRLSKYGLPYTA